MTALHSSAGHSMVAQGQAGAPSSPWAALPVRERVRRVGALRHVLAEQSELFIRAVGRVKLRADVETLSGELIPLADACRFLEEQSERLLRPRPLGRRGRPLWLGRVAAEIHREPLGQVLIIGPGNYPLMLPGIQVVQALVAGNRVVFKPAPGTAEVAKLLCDSLRSQGVLPDALVLLDEDPAAVVPWVEQVDKVFMTGSEASGKAVLRQLAEHVVPAVMELSGCDAAFVLPGADLELTAAALSFGLTFNDSATCMAPRRLFVHDAMADALAERLAQHLKERPLRSAAPAAVARLNELGQEALSRGAVVLAGKLPFDASMGPVVLDRADPAMGLLQQDVMAPVLSIVRVKSPEQALAAYERCPYRLGASVFGPDRAARVFAGQVSAGSVVINDLIVPTADPRLALSPQRRSGFGATRGAAGLLEMTRIKTISVRQGRPAHLRPQANRAGPLLLAYLQATHGRRLSERIKSWLSLMGEGRKLSGKE